MIRLDVPSERVQRQIDGLLDQAGDDDREKAIQLQDAALAKTQELGMGLLTERILARRDILRA